MYKVTVFNAVQCQREAGNHQIEGVPNSRVAVRCEHRQMLSNYIKILEYSWNVGTISGRSKEVVEVMSRRN